MFQLTLIIIQLPPTTIMTNIPAPNNDPIAIVAVASSSAVNAATAEKISGAPFPNATRVTPATLSDKWRLSEMWVSAGTKNASAVMPSATNKYTALVDGFIESN